MRLQGKVTLVAGAASGIGYAIAELLAAHGAVVFAGAIGAPEVPYAGGIHPLRLDVSDEGDWEKAIDTVFEKWGRLDVLINVAGLVSHEPLHELELFSWGRTIAIDQTGVFLGMREAVRVMRRQRSGAIVNVAPICCSSEIAGAHACQAASGAVRTMSRNAAVTYACDGIRINAICPGLIQTNPNDGQAARGEAIICSPTSLKRDGRPIEVAYACLFLASDEASYVSGAELVVDGGFTAR